MKNILTSVTVAIISLFIVVSFPVYAELSGGVKWEFYSDDAYARADRSYSPILLFVTAGWCQYCKKMDEETFHNPAIVKYIKTNYIPVVVSADEISLIKKYNITALPAIIIMNAQGKVIDEFSGYRDSKDTMKVLTKAFREYQVAAVSLKRDASVRALHVAQRATRQHA